MFADAKAFNGFAVDDLQAAQRFHGSLEDIDTAVDELAVLEQP